MPAPEFENIAQQFVFGKLNGQITASVYDDVPYQPTGEPSTDFPYVTIGEGDSEPWDADDWVGAQVYVDIHVWARYDGMKQMKTIMNEIYNQLNRTQEVSETDYLIQDCLWQGSKFIKDADQRTRHCVMEFRLTMYSQL